MHALISLPLSKQDPSTSNTPTKFDVDTFLTLKAMTARRHPRQSFQNEIYDPIKWSQYFDSQKVFNTENGNFNSYIKGDTGPFILCLHGGGYSGLTWAIFAQEIHSRIECRIVALDLRGHGNSASQDDENLDLKTLSQDVLLVVQQIVEESREEEKSCDLIILGHSLGAAVASEICQSLKEAVALCIIDLVEGPALRALSSMQDILRVRPKFFQSSQHAVHWCYNSGHTQNIESARVSMPGQIVNLKTGQLASEEAEMGDKKPILRSDLISPKYSFTLPLLPEDQDEEISEEEIEKQMNYGWRIDLAKTEQYWKGWFKGFSDKFINLQIPKVLLLTNNHEMDTSLIIGQMQGKFQVKVLSKSGHAIHEDQPQLVAEVVSTFLLQQKLVSARGESSP